MGDRVGEVYAARDGVVVRMISSHLFFCLRPDLPLLMAREQAEARQPSPVFGTLAARMRSMLEKAELTAIEKVPSDRLLTFRFKLPEGEESLLFFLAVPNRVDLVLAGAEGIVIAGFNADPGEPYLPPSPPPGEFDIYEPATEKLKAFLEKISGDDNPEKSIKAGIKGAGPQLAAEIVTRLEDSVETAMEFLEELRELRFRAGIFSPETGDETSLLLLPDNYRVDVIEPPELFDDPNDAADIFFRKRMRAAAFALELSQINSVLKQRSNRLKKLASNLQNDLKKNEKETDIDQLGNLILANIGRMGRGLDKIEVEDIYKGDGSMLSIDLDPALDPAANAKRYYKRARKARRAVGSISDRLAELDGELSDLAKIEGQSAACQDSSDLKGIRALRKQLTDRGWITQRQRKREKIVAKPGRRFLSSDGLEIVIGRNNRDNEKVTFGVGKDNDFWFHTAGYGGSHVLVRNTHKLERLPAATMAEAASLAAYYSKARQSRNVQVHWTERRFLKKVRGGEPGKVLLTSYRSLTADPDIPQSVRKL